MLYAVHMLSFVDFDSESGVCVCGNGVGGGEHVRMYECDCKLFVGFLSM